MKRIANNNRTNFLKKLKTSNRKVSKLSNNSFYQKILEKDGVARICVIRSLGGIGDVLMCTPGLRELKRLFPKCHLTFAIDRHSTSNDVYYQIVENAPFIDSIVEARFLNHNAFDAVVDVSAVCINYERKDLPVINRIDLFAKAMGIQTFKDKLPFYETTFKEIEYARTFLKPYRNQKLVVLHTASFDNKRSWPAEKYRKLIEESKNYPIKFLLLDFNKKINSSYDNVVNISDTDLREMAAFISECDLFIGPDSGPMHLAGALQKKSLVMFGAVPAAARINYYANHESIQNNNLSCLGCWYEPCKINLKCMTELSVSLVKERMVKLLNLV